MAEYMFETITGDVLSTLIIAGIISVGSFCAVLYRCVHKQAQRGYRQSQAILNLTQSIEEQTKRDHPDYNGDLYKKTERLLKDEKGEF